MLKNLVKRRELPDFLLLGIVTVLVFWGILMVFSVSYFNSGIKFGTPFYFLKRHLLFGVIPGIICGLFCYFLPLNFLRKLAFPLFLINIGLLIMVFIPGIGIKIAGATRWINLKFSTCQPSEFLKLTFLLYLSSWLVGKTENSKLRRQTFFAFLGLMGLISLLLILQPDISTLGIILLSAMVVYFISNAPLKYFFLILIGGFSLLLFLINIAPYRMARVIVFLNPNLDILNIGYQFHQALITIGSGGLLGVGLGMSQQKFGFLPQPMTDAVFAIFAEETGFLGTLILVILFLMLFWRGKVIAESSPDKFSKFLALGITFWITLQAFLNISSLIGILPLAGTSLPFVSYGGSALITQLAGIGILLNISKFSKL